jgi:CubicO group peptidase (beta-lactamase class C family)
MRVLMWLVFAVAATSTLVAAACAPGPTQGWVAVITQIDFTEEPFHGTFEVTEGADVLGCSSGTFVDTPTTANAIHKEFTCQSGTTSGTFTAEFFPPSGPWKIVDATDDFSGLSGAGNFALFMDDTDPTAGVEALTGQIQTESPPPSPSRELEADHPASKIDKTLSFLTEEELFTGTVLVAQNGEVLLNQGYGLADRDKNLPNTPQTKYRLGSITKQFTAMAILMLQDQGKLNVQEPICRSIPECPAAWQEVTIHHLLTHTSGIPNFTDFPDYETTRASPSSPLQTIARFKDEPLNFKPGEQHSYSNSGYIVLGYVIEQASGQSYETFLKQNIFAPLQMKNTGYDHNDGSLATGYTGFYTQWEKAPYIDMTIPDAAGGFYSTSEDLYRWDQALYTEQLVSQELLHLMFTPHVKILDSDLSYGYGWVVGEMNNHQAVAHSGRIEGFATDIKRYPADKATVIVLSNRDTTNAGIVGDLSAQAVFGEK